MFQDTTFGSPIQVWNKQGLERIFAGMITKGIFSVCVIAAVGTLAIGRAGAINAALLAAAVLATTDEKIAAALDKWRAKQTASVADKPVTRK